MKLSIGKNNKSRQCGTLSGPFVDSSLSHRLFLARILQLGALAARFTIGEYVQEMPLTVVMLQPCPVLIDYSVAIEPGDHTPALVFKCDEWNPERMDTSYVL
jgi:hypothetical protein